jgi:leader peptidase (prepilin peptidase) / N-methyltransferase
MTATAAGGQPVPAPERFNLIVPRSACPACRAPITAWQNIPVISWLVLRGRCAACKAPFLRAIPLVELATGMLSAWVPGISASARRRLRRCRDLGLIALTGIDLDHQLLPDGHHAAAAVGGPPGGGRDRPRRGRRCRCRRARPSSARPPAI